MKSRIIIIISICVVVTTIIGVAFFIYTRNSRKDNTQVYTTQDAAVVNRNAIIVTVDEPDDFVSSYILEDYNNIQWRIARDVDALDIEEVYTFLSNSSDITNIDNVFQVDVYNSDIAEYRYNLSVKESGYVLDIDMP